MEIKPIMHVFQVTAGNESDLVRAETRDAAIAKFEKLTTIQGKKIDISKASAKHLFKVSD